MKKQYELKGWRARVVLYSAIWYLTSVAMVLTLYGFYIANLIKGVKL